MTYLEALRVLREFGGGPTLPLLVASSGELAPLRIFLQAAGARHGRDVAVRTLPFGTLGQSLHEPARPEECEVFLLMPWDLVPELDWRSGVAASVPPEEVLEERAAHLLERLTARRARLCYVAAAVPPLWPDPSRNAAFADRLRSLVRGAGGRVLPGDLFSLDGYLASGCPVAGAGTAAVADALLEAAIAVRSESAKVLVTDLDNTVWDGVIGDAGIEGIHFRPEGAGYRHFVYQSLLRWLRQQGVVLAAVSKNDPESATAPFRRGTMLLQEDDFVAIIGSWHAKSAQIAELATQLNLPLDAFVFVDDNPVELAEVALQLPAVRCVRFPERVAALPAFIEALVAQFARTTVSDEDRSRTELYRRRLTGVPSSEMAGADLTEFLRGLQMTLTIHDRTRANRQRALQLINKTNQFNVNGERLTEQELLATLASGGRLLTATLDDRAGTHGEVVACLIGTLGDIRSFVMSCRVFQRRVEHAFMAWMVSQDIPLRTVRFRGTERNAPARTFLGHVAADPVADGLVTLDHERVEASCRAALALFSVVDATGSAAEPGASIARH
jgi:FkbH-like protein